MTTNVNVEAHCGEGTCVKVTVTDENFGTEHTILQDGESSLFYAHGARAIHVEEVPLTKEARDEQ